MLPFPSLPAHSDRLGSWPSAKVRLFFRVFRAFRGSLSGAESCKMLRFVRSALNGKARRFLTGGEASYPCSLSERGIP